MVERASAAYEAANIEGHDFAIRAALLAALETDGLVLLLAKAMRQTEVNDDEDGWADLNPHDKSTLRIQANAALIALRNEIRSPQADGAST